MAKLSDASLDTLYERKPTAAVVKAIIAKEDFSQISPRWCSNVCALSCSKNPSTVNLNSTPVDILILQDHNAADERYKTGPQIEAVYRDIISHLASKNFPTLTYRVANVLKCTPSREEFGGKTALTQTKISKCSPYLLHEIRASSPTVIISLTTTATKALGFKDRNNNEDRGVILGNVVITQAPKITTMIRQNASGQMWGSTYLDILDRDFAKAGKLARGELVIPSLEESLQGLITNNQVIVCRSIEAVRVWTSIISNFESDVIVSIDTETTGLDGWAPGARLLTIQFGFRRPDGLVQSVVFPLWHRANNEYNPDEAWALLVPLLESETLLKVGHNLAFDVCYVAATTGVRIRGIVFDTMLLMHAVNSGLQKCYGLKRAVWDYLPETGLGGYEDKLPEVSEDEDVEDEEDSSGDEN